MRFTFPRKARLTATREFRRVYAEGERVRVYPLRVHALRVPAREGVCPGKQSRLGLAVSRRVGNAPVRNRWKRAVREAFRCHRHRLAAPCDIVVSVEWQAGEEDVPRVEDAFLEAMEALGKRWAAG